MSNNSDSSSFYNPLSNLFTPSSKSTTSYTTSDSTSSSSKESSSLLPSININIMSSKEGSSTTTTTTNTNNTLTFNLEPVEFQTRKDETIFTPVARAFIQAFSITKSLGPQIADNYDKACKSTAKAFVETVDVVEIKNNYNKANDLFQKTPPMAIVATATLLPILLFKKVPSVKDPALAAIGFGVSMYYCYPELVSKGSKKVLEFYKQKRDEFNTAKPETKTLPTTTSPLLIETKKENKQ